MPSTTDLREDPVFVRGFTSELVKLAIAMERDGDSTLRNGLLVCADRARLRLAEAEACTPTQGELFRELFA